jgi:hypothetical protein
MALEIMSSSKFASVLLSGLTVLLAACGGSDGDIGGGSSPDGSANQPAPTAEGVYAGSMSGSEIASDFQALVLENDDFWSIYGEDYGSVFYVYGFVQGSGISNHGTFTANSVKDFGYSPALSGQVSANYYSSNKTLVGSVSYGINGNIVFSGGPIAGSLYNYNTPALLSTITGAWSAISSYGRDVSITISSTGALNLKDGTCIGTGTVTPRPSGKNVYNLTVTFGTNGCALPGATTRGIAIAYPLSTGQTQIIAAITNTARTEGIAVFGIR